MMNEDKLLNVARYLEGDMELQEKEKFETQAETDAELRTLIAEYKNVHQTLKMKIAPSASDLRVEETLSSLNKQYFGSTPHVISLKPYLKWISVAAILVIGLLIWAPWSATLYEQYAISKEMSVAERGEGVQNNLEKAAELYNAKDFKAAAAMLRTAYLRSPEHSFTAYYYGLSLIETGQTAEARKVLLKISAGESVFKDDANYCIALSYLREKNKEEALKWLLKIPRGTSNYDKAQELIRKL